jgi:hypothetical protein
MLVAGACLVLLPVMLLIRIVGKERPLDSDEVRWLRRVADRMHREDILPYD